MWRITSMGIRICSIKWLCCRIPWVTPNPLNHPKLYIFCRPSYLPIGWKILQIWHAGSQLVRAYWQHTVVNRGVVIVTWPILLLSRPKISLEWLKLDTSNFVHWFTMWWYLALGQQTVPWVAVVTVTWRLWILGNKRYFIAFQAVNFDVCKQNPKINWLP